MAIYVMSDGAVEVRAPHGASRSFIEEFVEKKKNWIGNTQEEMRRRRAEQSTIVLNAKQVKEAKAKAKALLSGKCASFAGIMGVDYRSVKISSAKSRWGSCTSRGDLNFTYRLIFAEEELVDYIVVHELAHRREMNHSPRFWEVVERVLPDYRQRRAGLRAFQRQVAIVEKGEGCEEQQSLF